MNNDIQEIELYRYMENKVREKYRNVFEHIEHELFEEWSPIWRENGFDPSEVKLRVRPMIELKLLEPTETDEEKEIFGEKSQEEHV